MAFYGISTAFANLVLGAVVDNTSLSIPIVCAQLHKGNPGASGTSNASAVTSRSQVTFNSPSSGSVTITGGNPTWSMTTDETITAISLWSGFDGDGSAVYMFSLLLDSAKTVALGDLLNLTGCTLTFTGQAA